MNDTDSVVVTLQLAGDSVFASHCMVGTLCATANAATTNESIRIARCVYLDRNAGRYWLGPTHSQSALPVDTLERLNHALEQGWRTGRDVELTDEQGSPLMRGALREHPEGLRRWLNQYRNFV